MRYPFKKHIVKRAFFYIFYVIIISELFLRMPFFYNRIFKSYEIKGISYSFHIKKAGEQNFFYWTLMPDIEIHYTYPYHSYFFKTNYETKKIKINNLGFRKKNFVEETSKNIKKIAFIGDSFTFGWGLNEEETYPFKICEELNRLITGSNFECLNFGIPASNIYNTYHIFKNYVLKENPMVVLLGLNLNDVEPTAYEYDNKTQSVVYFGRVPDLFDGAPYDFKYEDNLLGFSYIIGFLTL